MNPKKRFGDQHVYGNQELGEVVPSSSGGVPATHNDLGGRSEADAHPVSSITGLQSALDGKTPYLSTLDTSVDSAVAPGFYLARVNLGGRHDGGLVLVSEKDSFNMQTQFRIGYSSVAVREGTTGSWTAWKALVFDNDSRLTDARPASDVYAWAKAAAKPSYTFGEIGSKPTTLAGYGITDAASATHAHAYSSLTGIPSTFTPSAHTHAYSSLTGIPSTFTPAAHTHGNADLTGLASASVSYAASAGNADTLDGFHASQLQEAMSQRDFPNGTLVQTSIPYGTNGSAFLLRITGNSYGAAVPFDTLVQGYIYNDTIINIGGIANGTHFSDLRAIRVGGNLAFWWPRMDYWQGFNVHVQDTLDNAANKVTSITDSALPTTDKMVQFGPSIRASIHSGNIGSQNVNSATYLQGHAPDENATGATIAKRLPGGGIRATDVFVDANYGHGIVGLYASTRYQQVYAMGGAYTMAADGISLNNFYGIAWTHSNVGGQSISGLGHQALFCMGGVTQTAIGLGVWTRGAVSAWGNITAYASDRRLKENIEVIPDALEKVKALHGVTYQWNTEGRNYLCDDGRRHAGVLAQEVQAVLPEAVCPAPFDVDGATGQSRTGQNYLTVQNERLVALLIEAVKELSAKVDRLEAEEMR